MTCEHLWHPTRRLFFIALRCLHCSRLRRVCWAWGPNAPRTNAAVCQLAIARGTTVDDGPGLMIYGGARE